MTDKYAKIVKQATRDLKEWARLRQELRDMIKRMDIGSNPEVRKEMAQIDQCIKEIQDIIRTAKQRMH